MASVYIVILIMSQEGKYCTCTHLYGKYRLKHCIADSQYQRTKINLITISLFMIYVALTINVHKIAPFTLKLNCTIVHFFSLNMAVVVIQSLFYTIFRSRTVL